LAAAVPEDPQLPAINEKGVARPLYKTGEATPPLPVKLE